MGQEKSPTFPLVEVGSHSIIANFRLWKIVLRLESLTRRRRAEHADNAARVPGFGAEKAGPKFCVGGGRTNLWRAVHEAQAVFFPLLFPSWDGGCSPRSPEGTDDFRRRAELALSKD